MNDVNFWTPYTLRGYLQLGDDDPASPTALEVTLEGRLREGYSRSDARAELAVLAAQQDGIHHGRHTMVVVTNGSMVDQPGNTSAVLTIVAFVFVALACLALVACANVVSLLLAVAHTRHVEMALRMALGSGSARLARMLLTETLALAAIAGVLASIVASRTPPYLIAWITQRPLTYPTHPSWHLFAFLFATTLLASLVVGSAPIRASLRLDLVAALRGLTKDSRDGPRALEQRAHGCSNRRRRGPLGRGGLARSHVCANCGVAGARGHEAGAGAEHRASRSRRWRMERLP